MVITNSVAFDFAMGGGSSSQQNLDATEKKMDMSLDDIIKSSRISRRPRTFNKNNNRNPINQRPRETFQRFVAARSSALRQGKFADARSRNLGTNFAATRAAARRAAATPSSVRSFSGPKALDRDVNHFNIPRKKGFARRRAGWSQNSSPAYRAAEGKMKISVTNNNNKLSSAVRRHQFGNSGFRPSESLGRNLKKVGGGQNQRGRFRTLDALFASFREQRNLSQPPVERNWRAGMPPLAGRRWIAA